MKRGDLVARARRAIGHGTLYRLGAGAPHTAPNPWDETGACDCSGFVCWALGISRYQPMLAFLKTVNGGWMNTDGMLADSYTPVGYFLRPAGSNPEIGDLLVYPSVGYAKRLGYPSRSAAPRIGHVGIISECNGSRVTKVVHCSSGNYRQGSDAIGETGPGVFSAVPYVQLIRFCGLE